MVNVCKCTMRGCYGKDFFERNSTIFNHKHVTSRDICLKARDNEMLMPLATNRKYNAKENKQTCVAKDNYSWKLESPTHVIHIFVKTVGHLPRISGLKNIKQQHETTKL